MRHNGLQALWNTFVQRLRNCPADDCVTWNFSTDPDGYGRIRRGKTMQAHRAAWVELFGPIPEDLCVLHSCDNPPCCNPKHLFLGTTADNNKDKFDKSRHSFGESHGRAKLTAAQVVAIRNEYVYGSSTRGTTALARKYGVCQKTLYEALHGKHWARI